jgi:hypothetical protein
MSRSGLCSNYATFKPISREEIEHRIHEVVAEVSSPAEETRGCGGGQDDFRWMAPAELVRRMRPHLGLN